MALLCLVSETERSVSWHVILVLQLICHLLIPCVSNRTSVWFSPQRAPAAFFHSAEPKSHESKERRRGGSSSFSCISIRYDWAPLDFISPLRSGRMWLKQPVCSYIVYLYACEAQPEKILKLWDLHETKQTKELFIKETAWVCRLWQMNVRNCDWTYDPQQNSDREMSTIRAPSDQAQCVGFLLSRLLMFM